MFKPHLFNYPITTEEAYKFWSSNHKCNIAKAIIAFSLNEEQANEILKRYGYSLQWRKRVLANFAPYLNDPEMKEIPFSPLSTVWWHCLVDINNIELEWVVREVEEDTIATEDGRPILTEGSYVGPYGPEKPLP